ncbi:MAG: sigma-70 family RNA polymerase sigma factor [Oscillospiraceae bacterium]|nr:sigma-70 family RNA polymerase sigma factor [Oscillospiraceae bacterium]
MIDSDYFDSIYREYHDKVYGYIIGHVGISEDAEDLCSEVFRKAMEHYDPERGPGVSSYLYTTTRNTVIDYYRTRKVSTELTEDIPAEGSLEDQMISADTLDRLADALRQIPERDRDIIVLHYYEGNTLTEISEMMSLPYSVIKRAHKSALKKLQDIMGAA